MTDPAIQYLRERAAELNSSRLLDLAAKLEAMDDRAEPWTEGPALTPTGQVVDLDGDLALFFSHGKDLSPSADSKREAKDRFRLMRAAQVAHAACEAEDHIVAGRVPSIDADGQLHGSETIAPPSPEMKAAGADRQKLFHSKRNIRRRAENQEERVKEWAAEAEEAILRECWEQQDDEAGECIPYSLDFQDPTDCLKRQISVGDDGVVHGFERQVSIDSQGVVHDSEGIRPPSAADAGRAGERLKMCHRKRMQETGPDVLCLDDSGTVQSRASPCRIDPDGVIRNSGGICPPSPEHKSGRADQLKNFHRKRIQRSDGKGDNEAPTVVSIDSHGNVQSRESVQSTPLIEPATACAC